MKCNENFVRINSIEKLINNNDTPSLIKLSKIIGEKSIIAYIKIWLINLNESLNLKNKMNEEQINECSFFLFSDYKKLSILDLWYVFTNIKKGKYGSMYESISTDKICKIFELHFENRINISENINISKHNNTKELYIPSKEEGFFDKARKYILENLKK